MKMKCQFRFTNLEYELPSVFYNFYKICTTLDFRVTSKVGLCPDLATAILIGKQNILNESIRNEMNVIYK